jgi:hypothetical protein
MTYSIERSGSQYSVVDDKGKVVGTYNTEDKAKEQITSLNSDKPENSKEDAIRYGRRRSGIGDSRSGINTGGATITAADQIKELASVIKQMVKEISSDIPSEQEVKSEEYKEFNETSPNTDAYDNSVGKSYQTIWGGSVLDLSPFYK